MKLKISKKDFFDWYIQDRDDLIAIGEEVIKELETGSGEYATSLKIIWENLGYLPIHVVTNPKAIKKEHIEDDAEIPECFLEHYEVEWVK